MDRVVSMQALELLRSSLSGSVILPGDDAYDSVRRLHNGMVDKRPAVIARCQDTADIADAVSFGRDEGLEICVRGGGHGVAGRAVADGALMIDLQAMKGIHVDPKARTARAQAGLTWQEYNRATHAFGLASTGGAVSTTGIAGLTVGGGIGWLMGKLGIAIDCLRSVEIVTADGQIRTASEDEEPDLFWAVRGGGGNFGVVSSFEFDLHPVSTVLGGLIAFPLSEAASVLEFFRDAAGELPDDLMAMTALVHAPDGSGVKLVALALCHSGDLDRAENDLKPFRSLPSAVLDAVQPMPYPVMNTLLDDAFPRGARNYWKSAFLTELSDDAIATMVERFATTRSIMNSIGLENFHGKATRVDATATAFPHRKPGMNLAVFGQWLEPADDEENIAWTTDTFSSLTPNLANASYVNYLDDDDSARVSSAYGPNWPRLLEIKRRYDPDNLFHFNQNIDPNAR